MRHAEAVSFHNPLPGDIGELSVPVVRVYVHSGKVAHHQQVQITVAIKIGERRAIAAAPTLFREAGSLRRVAESAASVVQKQVGRVTIIRVIKRRGHLAALVRCLVLSQPDIQIAIAVDVTATEHLSVLQSRAGEPNELARFFEPPLRRPSEQH